MCRKILASGFVLWRWHFFAKSVFRGRVRRYSPRGWNEILPVRKARAKRRFPVTEVFSLVVEEQVKMSEMPGSSAASYGSFFPRWTSTRRGGLLLSPAFPDEFQPGEGTGGGRRIMLSSWVAAPPCAANSRRLNCLPDGVTCRYAAYTGDELATSICAMKNLGGAAARSAKRS